MTQNAIIDESAHAKQLLRTRREKASNLLHTFADDLFLQLGDFAVQVFNAGVDLTEALRERFLPPLKGFLLRRRDLGKGEYW